jgi:thiamine-monophosphate kinase
LAEFDLIERIRRAVGAPGLGTVVGIGDDAAVFEPSGQLELVTCDAFVEGVHFRRDYASFREIGAKCMVANVSDVAAMGGFPSRAVVSVCVPSDVSEDDMMEFYGGMLDVCSAHGFEIAGGDVVGSPRGLVVSITLIGAVDRGRIVTRAGAVPGDVIVVTGELGASEAGLMALGAGFELDGAVSEVVNRHLSPVARIAEAQAILEVATPHAMIDVSDGLSSDVTHIAEESGVGVRLYAASIPVASAAVEVARMLETDAVDLALASGEEFELVVAIPASECERTAEHVEAVTGTPVTMIGEIVETSVGCVIESADGSYEPLELSGYEHLSQ